MTTSAMDAQVRSADDVAGTSSEPLEPSFRGIDNTIISQHRGAYAGILHVAAGCRLPEHRHRHMGHHVFVFAGRVEAFGRQLGAGSYWFVPRGRAHEVRGVGPDGCTLFYVDVPE